MRGLFLIFTGSLSRRNYRVLQFRKQAPLLNTLLASTQIAESDSVPPRQFRSTDWRNFERLERIYMMQRRILCHRMRKSEGGMLILIEKYVQLLGMISVIGCLQHAFFPFSTRQLVKTRTGDKYTAFRIYGARFCPPKMNHIGGKTIYLTNFITLEPIWDHPKVAHITEKTIYPRPI